MRRTRIPVLLAAALLAGTAASALAQLEAPGWQGHPLVSGAPAAAWTLDGPERGTGGGIAPTPDEPGAVRLTYAIGEGSYVQMKRDLEPAVDLSEAALLGITFRGVGEEPNNLAVMLVDGAGMFVGADLLEVSRVGRWLRAFPLPKPLFARYWGGREDGAFDWSDVRQVFVTVKRVRAGQGGGRGTLDLLELTWARADEIPARPLADATGDPERAERALAWLLARQGASGFVKSWLEEAEPRGYLYDQALALLAFQRGAPQAAERLAAALVRSLGADSRWPRAVDTGTGAALAYDSWLGDQAWAAFALATYGKASNDRPAVDAAARSAARIASLVHTDGSVEELRSTEGCLDVVWALSANGFADEADRVAMGIFDRHWDEGLGYFYRGAGGERPDPIVACDAQTWGSALARRWNRPDVAERALRFARATLMVEGPDGVTIGLDGQGPVSPWCEGMGQYVAAGGPDSGAVLEQLERLQDADGGLPGGTEDVSTGYGWVTTMHGTSSTAWLYFALTGSPFPTR
jgi:hypothetical protein